MDKAVLTDRKLKELISEGQLRHTSGLDLNDYIQPASIDIPVGDKAYMVKFKFLPFMKNIKDVVESISLEELDLAENPVLYKGQTYLIPCLNFTSMPKGTCLRVSPKSSIGRIDLMVRAICDNSSYYDYIDEPKGTLWVEVTPRSFNVRLSKGTALSQLMILEEADTTFDLSDMQLAFDEQEEPVQLRRYARDEIILSIDIPEEKTIGYVARTTNEIIDLNKKAHHDKKTFFEEMRTYGTHYRKISLEQGKFYILKTKEFIQIPPGFSGEMVPLNNLLGEFRVHYAGFFDPGFGYGIKGNQGVLEIRPHEDLVVYDGQPICSMKFYRNTEEPEKLYGLAGNNYAKQKGVKLAKYFK